MHAASAANQLTGGSLSITFAIRASFAEHLVSVTMNVICFSTNVRFPTTSVSHNPSAKEPSIAVPAAHHCEPLQLAMVILATRSAPVVATRNDAADSGR